MTEAAKLQDGEDEEKRFRVHRAGEEVHFYGSLTDTTTFEALDDVLGDNCVCDFANLKFASWIGLSGFNSHVVGRGLNIKIKNISRRIFDCYKLFECDAYTTFLSAEVYYIDLKTKKIGYENTNLEELEKKYADGEIINADGKIIFLPQRFAIQSAYRTQTPIMFEKGWMKEDCEEASFWVSYLSFIQATFDLSETLLHATETNLMELLGGICHTIVGGEEALKIVDPKTSYTLVKRLNENIDKIQEHIQLILKEMMTYVEKTREIMGKILCEVDEPTSKEAFTALIKEYFETIKNIKDVAAKFEIYGPAIGEQLTQLRMLHVLKGAISKISTMEDDQLEEIRDAFSIMDIMSEDSWPDTKVEILKEIDGVESKVGKCVTTLQGFDLLRQILEHRYNEGEIVQEQLPDIEAGNIHWAGLKDALFEKIGKQLVTDQEKSSYAFYLPEGFSQYGDVDRKEPGDVLLF